MADMSQTIHQPWGVSAVGSAILNAVPDLARIRVAISQTRPNPGEAFAATRAGVDRVRDVLRRHGVPDTAVFTSRLDLRSSWSYDNKRRLLGYECTASFVIEIRELDALESVLIDVVEAGANQVDNVEFDVSTKQELQAQARRDAVAAAREKAELYAEAAGARLGPVIHIQDVDHGQGGVTFGAHSPRQGAGGDSGLTPGRISVAAEVTVGYSLISG